jgi:hypothetical protein
VERHQALVARRDRDDALRPRQPRRIERIGEAGEVGPEGLGRRRGMTADLRRAAAQSTG